MNQLEFLSLLSLFDFISFFQFYVFLHYGYALYFLLQNISSSNIRSIDKRYIIINMPYFLFLLQTKIKAIQLRRIASISFQFLVSHRLRYVFYTAH